MTEHRGTPVTEEERRMPVNQPCHYCGEVVTGKNLHKDHFVPKFLGGPNALEKRVYSCGTCNVIKGRRSIEVARFDLLQKRLGWPRFSPQQLCWLRENGFDLSPLDQGRLAFETFRD